MPQMAPIALNDGTSDHTFNPRGIDANNVATLVESTGVPLGDKRLTVQRSRTTQGREKVTLKMTFPVVQTQTENGISSPKIVRSAYADVTLSFDPGSSTSERNDMRLMLADLLGDGQTFGQDVIDNLESLF